MKGKINKILHAKDLHNEAYFSFASDLRVKNMSLIITILHYKYMEPILYIRFNSFESFNTKEESLIYSPELDEKNSVKFAPFFYELNQNTHYFQFMKNNITLGIHKLYDTLDLKNFKIATQNLIIDVISKDNPSITTEIN